MYDNGLFELDSIFSRELIELRAALEAVGADKIVSFDFINAVYLENMGAPDEVLSKTARDTVLRVIREFDPTLISYMNHTTFNVPGATCALIRLARSLAGAKIASRMIFLFDNDTAGHEGYQQFNSVNCPKHHQELILPHLIPAEMYPTIRPTGDAPANVNGRACGIELYCGPKALTAESGSLCPVQWKGYMDRMKRYQGEPLDKDDIKERFLTALRQSTNPKTDPAFEDMGLVLKALMEVPWN